jgi:AcrR family transcriptional regulator
MGNIVPVTRKYEQNLRAKRADETRRRILDALEERLRDAPTEPVSVDEIATRAEVSRSTIYVVFGSRSGLFDALVTDLFERAGVANLTEAVAHPDAREHLRGAMGAASEMLANLRDVGAALYAMSALDPDSVGGAIVRQEERRWGGMQHLARRLDEQGELREDITVDEAADVLWMLASFEAFDALYTGRGLAADDVARLLVATAERTLCR